MLKNFYISIQLHRFEPDWTTQCGIDFIPYTHPGDAAFNRMESSLHHTVTQSRDHYMVSVSTGGHLSSGFRSFNYYWTDTTCMFLVVAHMFSMLLFVVVFLTDMIGVLGVFIHKFVKMACSKWLETVQIVDDRSKCFRCFKIYEISIFFQSFCHQGHHAWLAVFTSFLFSCCGNENDNWFYHLHFFLTVSQPKP